MSGNVQSHALWMQIARIQDYADGSGGQPRSEMPDSPIGQTVWFSPEAEQSRNRPLDLAVGYAQLLGLRQQILAQGQGESDFVRTAEADPRYGPLHRWILTTYMGYA